MSDGEVEGRPGPAAAYARNWLTVLAVDALVGVAVVVLGVFLAISWNPVGGGFVGSLGAVYVVLVVRRGRGWAQLRRAAGL
jgi:hypothetical protein